MSWGVLTFRRSAACLLNGWHPKPIPQSGLIDGMSDSGFQWGADKPERAQDGTYFPDAPSERVVKIRSLTNRKPSVKVVARITTRNRSYGYYGSAGPRLGQIQPPFYDQLWLNDRINLKEYLPPASQWWIPHPQFNPYNIPTTEIWYIEGYSDKLNNQGEKVGRMCTIKKNRIVGEPYNDPSNTTYWPDFETELFETSNKSWTPEDDGFTAMENNNDDDPQYKWYYKVVGEDIGADKMTSVFTDAYPYGISLMWARDSADNEVQFDIDKEQPGRVTSLCAYAPDKTSSTSPFWWNRQDLKMEIYAVVDEPECGEDEPCWLEGVSYSLTVDYEEGTAESDWEMQRGVRGYPLLSGGGGGQWTQTAQIGEQESIPGWTIGGRTYKLATMEWNDVAEGTYKIIKDFHVSLD
jgi:hypothetical protein